MRLYGRYDTEQLAACFNATVVAASPELLVFTTCSHALALNRTSRARIHIHAAQWYRVYYKYSHEPSLSTDNLTGKLAMAPPSTAQPTQA